MWGGWQRAACRLKGGLRASQDKNNKQKEILRSTKQCLRLQRIILHDTREGKCLRLFLVVGEVLRILEWGFGNKEGGDSKKMTEKTWWRGTSYFAQLTRHYSEGRVKEDEIATMKGALETGEMHTKLCSKILMVKGNFEAESVRKLY